MGFFPTPTSAPVLQHKHGILWFSSESNHRNQYRPHHGLGPTSVAPLLLPGQLETRGSHDPPRVPLLTRRAHSPQGNTSIPRVRVGNSQGVGMYRTSWEKGCWALSGSTSCQPLHTLTSLTPCKCPCGRRGLTRGRGRGAERFSPPPGNRPRPEATAGPQTPARDPVGPRAGAP